MFSPGHVAWIVACAVLVLAGLVACQRRKPDLDRLMRTCLVLGVISEVIKVFSVVRIVPMVEPVVGLGGSSGITYVPTGEYTPMMGAEHLPLELCSLQLVFMLLCCVLKDEGKKRAVHALMYPTGFIGGILGIVLASITSYLHTPMEYLCSPRAWQYFLYHSMIVCLSLYIGLRKDGDLSFGNWKTAILGLVMLDVPTFYLNSLLSSAVYQNDQLVGVTHRINFFSSYVSPLGLVLTEKWQWAAYLAIRAALAVVLVIALYVPLRGRRTTEHAQEAGDKGGEAS